MNHPIVRLVACATALHLLGATGVLAQRISVTAVGATTSHELLNRPIGVMASFGVPISRRVHGSFSVARLQRSSDGTGIVCGGLINPSQCPVESFAEKGRISMVGIGADVQLVTARMAGLSVQPQFLWGRARAETLGDVTGNRLFSDRAQLGFSAGVELRSFPGRQFPIGVVAGAALARVGPANVEGLVDGYTPFDRWYSLRTVYVGGVLQWTRR